MSGKLRWGILGTGNIARQFCTGLLSSTRGIAAMVGSRKQETADEFAKQYRIPVAADSYQAVVEADGIDAIYNSLPNDLHHPWTIAALKAGKHVLCEKPLALDEHQAREMFDAAKAAGKTLVEAFMYRWHPQTLEVVKAARSGTIGNIRGIRTSFCFRTRNIDSNVRFVRTMGGGALMDIGCYCVNFSRLIAGAEPTAIHAIAQMHPYGIDEVAAGTMAFANGISATFICGMSLQSDNTAYILGDEGYIEIPVPWKPATGLARYNILRGMRPKMDKDGGPPPPPREAKVVDCQTDLYAIEADEFAAIALDGKPSMVTPADSLGNMHVLDEMRRQVGLSFR